MLDGDIAAFGAGGVVDDRSVLVRVILPVNVVLVVVVRQVVETLRRKRINRRYLRVIVMNGASVEGM